LCRSAARAACCSAPRASPCCVGLYGLAASTMARSVKEVGVRKALGASVAAVTLLFLWRFSRPVLAANLIAWPVAGYYALQWIQRFPYQLEVAWLPPLFAISAALVLVLAWLTVGGVTAAAAMRQPVQSLRYE
jgi:putative ABC transport system permease protein